MPGSTGRFMDDVARLVTDAAGVAHGVRREAETVMRTQTERILATMNVVTREEFEAVRAMPLASAASAAIRPGPIALVTIANPSARGAGPRVSVSSAASMSSNRATVSTPTRLSAASNTSSARPDGSSKRLPARKATTGRSRAAARAAERKARGSRTRRMSSRIGPVALSRER